jgi:hypothetical protein
MKRKNYLDFYINLFHYTRRANGTSMGNGTIPASKHP